jgi:hypothetical protein
VCAQLCRRRCGAGGDDVRDEALDAGLVLAGQHRHRGHARVGGDGRLDLAQLDAEAAHLHLVVGAAQVVQVPGGQPAGQVAGAVHPLPRAAEGIGHEPLRGQARPVEVAARQAVPGHVHLAGHPGRHRGQVRVEQVHPKVREGHADGAAGGLRRPRRVEGEVRDVHGGLGDAVHVHQHRRVVPVPRVPPRQAPQVQRLAAEDHVPQGQPVAGLRALLVGAHQLVERRGRLVEHGHPLVGQQREELPR